MSALVSAIFFLWIGWVIGWAHAHYTVAGECEKLGGFFVGKKIYKCTSIDKNPETGE